MNGAELAFAAGFVLRYILVCGCLIALAGLMVSGLPEARGGRDG